MHHKELSTRKLVTYGQVSKHLLGPGHLTSGELHNVSSTAVDDSLQSLANQMQSLAPEASELTQRALQIGNKLKVCFCKAMPPVFGLVVHLHCMLVSSCTSEVLT